MNDIWMDRLSEYFDGELNESEQRELEAHLAGCDDCRVILSQLGLVVARAGSLSDREPVADLWPPVREAMNAGKVVSLETKRRPARRFSFSLSQLTAAAAALVLVSAGGAWLAISQGAEDPAGQVTAAPNNPAALPVTQAGGFDPRGRADSAIIELETILAEGSGRLDSSTVRILTENLALIDRAIGQARAALQTDPNSAYLNDHLARTMRKKIEVLRRAADLAQVS